jgi:hypothetical protein
MGDHQTRSDRGKGGFLKKLVPIVLALALLGIAGCRVFQILFPGDEAKILKLLDELNQAVSAKASTKPLSQMRNAAHLAGFFTTDVEIRAKGPGGGVQRISGRTQLQQVALTAQSMSGGLNLRFEDIVLDLGSEEYAVTCRLTAIATRGGDPNPWVQILQFDFKEVDGDWMIARVETVDAVERIQ